MFRITNDDFNEELLKVCEMVYDNEEELIKEKLGKKSMEEFKEFILDLEPLKMFE